MSSSVPDRSSDQRHDSTESRRASGQAPLTGAEPQTPPLAGLPETNYRELFDQMREGFALHEMLFDAQGQPVDYRFLEVNRAFERLTGFQRDQIVGRTAREVLPGIEAYWIETFARVVVTGQSVRFENYSAPLERHYDGVAYPLGERRFAVSLADVTAHKRLEDRLRQESTCAEALARSAARLNRQLELSAVLDAVCDEVSQALGVPGVILHLYDAGTQRFELVRAYGLSPEAAQYAQQHPWLTDADSVEAVRRAFLHGDVLGDLRSPHPYSSLEPDRLRAHEPQAALSAGMIRDSEIVGIITALRDNARAFDADARVLLRGQAVQATQAVSNARLLAQVTRQASELATLHDMTSALIIDQNFDQLLGTLVESARALLRAHGGAIFLMDERRTFLELAVAKQFPVNVGARIAVGEGVAGRVAQNGEPLIVEDYGTWHGRAPQYADLPVSAVVAVPMKFQGRVIGVLAIVEVERSARSFSRADAHLLSLFAAQAASIVHYARVLRQSERRATHLEALRSIDLAITSSMDVRVTLNVVLDKVMGELRVDAAGMLLLNPTTHMLESGIGRGFRTGTIEHMRVRAGQGLVGRVVLERRTLYVPELVDERALLGEALSTVEGFVSYMGVPLLAKGAVLGVLAVFHRTALEPDNEWQEFLEALAGQAAIAIENGALFSDLWRSNSELVTAYDTTIEGWSRALDLRDRETEGHTMRVTEVTLRLADSMGVRNGELLQMRRGALLHDIGKMAIPDKVLLKPGPLDDDEWRVMRLHPRLALDLLSPVEFLKSALDIPYCHHEKWDGSGYPRALAGEQIPLPARIFAVVDVWDALRSNRPYRAAWPEEQVLAHIRKLSGNHFDPRVVEAFFNLDAG